MSAPSPDISAGSGRDPAPRSPAPAPPRIRADLPFRRPALVLSGGGALGAYEVGVLRVLEAVGFRPAVLAGVSIGAINAVVWRAHDGRTRPLEDVWRRITPADVGFRWVTLLLRALGGVIAVVGLFELVLTLAGSRELSGSHWLWHRASARLDLASTVLDLWMWGLFTMAGISAALFSRQVETWLARRRPGSVSRRTWWRAGRVLLGLWLVYGVVWLGGFPWPHRFTVSVLAVATLLWVANRPGQSNRWARLLLHAFLPETRGRGLWSAAARKRMVELLVAAGDRRRLVDPDACLILSALALDTGRTTHFVSGGRPDDDFARRLAEELGEVVVVRDPADVQVAALASSAIPGIFEPVRLIGRDFVDAGGFTNQPLHVALAAGADAVLVVLLSPSGSPAPAPPPESLFALAGRLLELANWRDMQTELRSLPPEWLSAQSPARLCVVEPDSALPGGVLGFDPAQAGGLIARGEEDAWRALERAGWLERCAAENASAL